MRNRRQSLLNDDRVGRLLLKLSGPAFLGMFVMTLYNVVDTVFIGRYVGPTGIAALSVSFPFQIFSLGIGQLMGMGASSLISRAIGAQDIEKAERTLGNALSGVIIFYIILIAVGIVDLEFWLTLMGSSPTILPYAMDYMTIILVGNITHIIAMCFNFLLNSEGNARVAMTGMILGSVLNILLDALLIIVFDMGIQGAAIATVIAQIFSVLYYLRFYLAGKSFLKIHPANLIIRWSILKRIMAIGIASFSRTMAVSVTSIFVNRTIVNYGGDLSLAAFGIVNRLMMFGMMPSVTIGQGLQPILGFNYGAKRFDRALKVIKIAYIASTSIGLLVFLVLFFVPEPFIRIFTDDAELIPLSAHAAKRIFLAIYLVGFISISSLIFQSIGKAKLSFITAISRPFLFLLPLVLILPRFMELEGIWFAYPFTDIICFVLALVLIIPQLMEFRRQRKEQETISPDTGKEPENIIAAGPKLFGNSRQEAEN